MRTGSVVRPNSDSTVEQRLFGLFLDVLISNRLRGAFRHQQIFGRRGLVKDLDAHVVEGADDGFDLLRIHHVVRQMVINFGVSEEPTLLAQRDEGFQARAAHLQVKRLGQRRRRERSTRLATANPELGQNGLDDCRFNRCRCLA